jgi:probable HAF family extracellular repeat protein
MPVCNYTTLDGPLATGGTGASDINDMGEVVGYYLTAAGGHGFLYNGGVYTTLDDPSAISGATFARGITNNGQIVGEYSDGHAAHGFLLSGGIYTTIDDPLGTGLAERRLYPLVARPEAVAQMRRTSARRRFSLSAARK